jgi:hypothetical protein
LLTAVAVKGLMRRANPEAKGAIHADEGLVEPLNAAPRFCLASRANFGNRRDEDMWACITRYRIIENLYLRGSPSRHEREAGLMVAPAEHAARV